MIQRHILQAVTTERPKQVVPPFSKEQRIAITDDGNNISHLLAAGLQAKGFNATVVYEIPTQTDVLILLDGLREVATFEAATQINKQAFLQVRAIAERFTEQKGVLITVQSTGGQFGVAKLTQLSAWTSGIAGLTKTAAVEWPKSICRAIDIDKAQLTAQALADRLLEEILNGGTATEIGLLADGRRISLQTLSADVINASPIALNETDVFLVSGGARGITADCLLTLAAQAKCRFILLGRTALFQEPDYCKEAITEVELRNAILAYHKSTNQAITLKEINQQAAKISANRAINNTLRALQQHGSEYIYLNVDVLNGQQLNTALLEIRQRWKKITGIIHGAGVLADKLIAQKTEQQFDMVFTTKVLGLHNLLEVTRNDPLKMIILFSSVAARFGNTGQCDYAMANEILNKVAQYEQQQRGTACRVKAINWGPWESGMVTPQLKALFQQRGIALIPPQVGVQLFINELQTDDTVEAVYGGRLTDSLPSQQSSANNIINVAKTFSIDAQAYPFLTSHVIEDVPVVPACLVLEWFVQTVKAKNTQITVVNCLEFRVLKGIRLPDYHQAKHTFITTCEIIAEQNQQPVYALKLQSQSGTLHYSAKITTQPTSATIAANINSAIEPISTCWPWEINEIYYESFAADNDHRLFHGKDFQVIQTLDQVSDKGGSGTLIGLKNVKAWSNQQSWQIDALALDGVFQMVRLWGYRMLSKPSLPTYIQEANFFNAGIPSNNLRCIFQAQVKGNYRIVCDALLMNNNGELYAQLKGLEMCAVPKAEKKNNHV